MKRTLAFFLLIALSAACKKDKSVVPPVVVNTPVVTSPGYIDNLLFVNQNNYQITTADSATFSSADPNIVLSASGLIASITSGEIVAITITWKKTGTPNTTIYALGATDIDQLEPAAYFHGETATDPYHNYVQGWKLLERLPVTDTTYAMVMRHADASFGRDWPAIHTEPAPANWWMSSDSLLARQLNVQGVQRAKDLGQAFKDLDYPIKRVITSEFYRSRETAMLINATPAFTMDYRINHETHNVYAPGIFNGVIAVAGEQPIDNQMSLIITHHPGNEPMSAAALFPSFPAVSAFNWSGSYFLKIAKNGTITYGGAVTYAMIMHWRDVKLKRL